MTSKGPLREPNDLPIDFGCVACSGDRGDSPCPGESLRDVGLLLRIACVIFGCVLLAMTVLVLLLGPEFIHVFI